MGVLQGSIFGRLLFLVYIIDVVHIISSNIRLFENNTSLYIIVDNPNFVCETLYEDINIISR